MRFLAGIQTDTLACLQEEAAAGRQRLSQDQSNLYPQYKEDGNVQPPYTYNQITESARHTEILNIYRLAAPETRQFYERGRYIDGPNEENWVIRWCLYHSFRYTDNRNRVRSKANRAAASGATQPSGSGTSSSAPGSLGGARNDDEQSETSFEGSDGARPRFSRTVSRTDSIAAEGRNVARRTSSTSRSFYDPVRDL